VILSRRLFELFAIVCVMFIWSLEFGFECIGISSHGFCGYSPVCSCWQQLLVVLVSWVLGKVVVDEFWNVVIQPASCNLNLVFGGDDNFTKSLCLFYLCAAQSVEKEFVKGDVLFVFVDSQCHVSIEGHFIDSLDGNGSAS